MTDDDPLAGYREHLDRFWPDSAHEEVVSHHPRIDERVPGFRVRRIAPATTGQPWVYATIGASQAADEHEDGSEFFVLSPVEDPILPEMLAAVATVHVDPRTRLLVGSTIAIGRPWVADSGADHLLVSLPYPYGPQFELCELDDRRVRVLWLVPIHEAEARLVHERGHRALEQLIEEARANVAAAHRRSVV
jgi:hypothetical protein